MPSFCMAPLSDQAGSQNLSFSTILRGKMPISRCMQELLTSRDCGYCGHSQQIELGPPWIHNQRLI